MAKYDIHLSRIYLEIARSIIDKPLKELTTSFNSKKIDNNKSVNIGFGIVSISCVYSYAAIEAFCNKHLWDMKVKISEAENAKEGETGWKYLGWSRSDLNKNKLGFNGRDGLKDKLTKLCKLYRIKEIEEANLSLWNRFIKLMRDARNFIIHPNPEPGIFQDKMNKFLNNYNTGEYVDIAVDVLKYFYTETKTSFPEWLNKNTLLEFSGITSLPSPGDIIPNYPPPS